MTCRSLLLPSIIVSAVIAGAWRRGARPAPPPAGPAAGPEEASVSELKALQAKTARFAPVDIEVDVSALPDYERRGLGKLVGPPS